MISVCRSKYFSIRAKRCSNCRSWRRHMGTIFGKQMLQRECLHPRDETLSNISCWFATLLEGIELTVPTLFTSTSLKNVFIMERPIQIKIEYNMYFELSIQRHCHCWKKTRVFYAWTKSGIMTIHVCGNFHWLIYDLINHGLMQMKGSLINKRHVSTSCSINPEENYHA